MDYRTRRPASDQRKEVFDKACFIFNHMIPPAPLPTYPAEPGMYIHPQTVDTWSRHGPSYGLNTGQAAPISYPHSQAGPYSQAQFNNAQETRLPQGLHKNLTPVGTVNGKMVYALVPDRGTPFAPAAPMNHTISQESQLEGQQVENMPYIKRPPNAFMIYSREQRANVVAELNNSDNAVVNTVLGQRWRIMSEEEQAKYYQEANKQRRLHCLRFPDWSAKDNYGKKRKRIRRRAPGTRTDGTGITDSPSSPRVLEALEAPLTHSGVNLPGSIRATCSSQPEP